MSKFTFLWRPPSSITRTLHTTSRCKRSMKALSAAILAVPLFVALQFLPSASPLSTVSIPVPEVSPQRLEQVSTFVSSALGDSHDDDDDDANHPLGPTKLKDDRYASARKAALEWETSSQMESYELVYGELSIPVLTTILDAVGVLPGDKFLDVGSGDGALCLGASLLYASEEGKNAIEIARGLEIVPGLYERSLQHENKLQCILEAEGKDAASLRQQQAPVEFYLGDIHEASSDPQLTQILNDSTLVVCFATTWSAGNAKETTNSLQGRKLPLLSKALQGLPRGARVVVVDGRLDAKDGHEWQGDLKIYCPDTAPWSIAALYQKR